MSQRRHKPTIKSTLCLGRATVAMRVGEPDGDIFAPQHRGMLRGQLKGKSAYLCDS